MYGIIQFLQEASLCWEKSKYNIHLERALFIIGLDAMVKMAVKHRCSVLPMYFSGIPLTTEPNLSLHILLLGDEVSTSLGNQDSHGLIS